MCSPRAWLWLLLVSMGERMVQAALHGSFLAWFPQCSHSFCRSVRRFQQHTKHMVRCCGAASRTGPLSRWLGARLWLWHGCTREKTLPFEIFCISSHVRHFIIQFLCQKCASASSFGGYLSMFWWQSSVMELVCYSTCTNTQAAYSPLGELFGHGRQMQACWCRVLFAKSVIAALLVTLQCLARGWWDGWRAQTNTRLSGRRREWNQKSAITHTHTFSFYLYTSTVIPCNYYKQSRNSVGHVTFKMYQHTLHDISIATISMKSY